VINTSGFATQEFIVFSKQVMDKNAASIITNTLDRKSPYPYFILNRKNVLFPDGAPFIVSPICMSGSNHIRFSEEFEHGELAGTGITGGFLQTRDTDQNESGLLSTSHYHYYVDTRTNYRLTLGLDDNELLKSMKRDSRARVRKVLAAKEYFELKKAESSDSTLIAKFAKLYTETAKRANFSALYTFREETWHTLLSNPLWNLFILEYKGDIVAGAVVSTQGEGYDYTFMAYQPCDVDVSRAIIIFIYKYLSNEGHNFLDLGGGISEGDNLARFKSGLGANETHFKRVRFASNNALKKHQILGTDNIRTLLTKRWP